MKRKLTALSQKYLTGLKMHLKHGSRSSRSRASGARELGQLAVALRLEPLELAQIHERALAKLKFSEDETQFVKRADVFFTDVIAPLVRTHRSGQSKLVRKRLNQTLNRRTAKLAATNRALKQGIARHKTVETGLRKSGEHSKKLLEESHHLQKHLQYLTRQMLSAQEDKRKKLSNSLQDEIAQTLLGINVRLLTLKQETVFNARGFKKDIASTQRLVEQSIRSINRFAHKLDHDA
jgi:signal transduction histidine kinase